MNTHDTSLAISHEAIKAASIEIDNLLNSYHMAINRAYLSCDNELTVSLKVKMKPNRTGGVEMEVGISFVESKTTYSVKLQIGGKQQKLFKEEADSGN